MQITLDLDDNQYILEGYGDNFIQINGRKIFHSLILSANTLIEPWPVKSIQSLQLEHFHDILRLQPSILLLGTGSQVIFPKIEQLTYLQQIPLEVMDTLTACRVYKSLSIERQGVVVALMI